ncbi:MAG: hypothetical protein A2725_03505 [Candidatus Magasanikbacteria bacterium RIFCSPHIGHO2_01_FULL_33_34]|uniref:MgtC/SapB/SrpB/YhiD N-terminal domain-containing protein n=1 Tax=Candidatus Magasanikbacteria bacterium RIFCSPHIGHO2_01_FULL_33_34 TaxID=1798671 RepID=A0A1F6LHG2_9BACT|nr:MAG: hypothetical protein A2725_03505 [Candidatus Magasanikbacteria bacterium RIFCSPHIGHO2_01_FULL_33_34]OGH66194.1 MAG: hypothetical protein A3B83_00995 [Candidatus Magasanikbacteria bacterium RIFCSPHIGHO2_02_FULL_33_17]OGH76040.1 MAG: hypothetical protein A3A89_00905 [Candidatus Magasanikbacteria bacterium RIFCSPLOWO2_01_FULL_33_34]
MEYIIFTGQLFLSIFLGSLIGWQRHNIGKAAGARTFAMVSVGSTLFTLLSINMSSGDPSRIAAQILTGIGFIGAGTIIHKKDNVEGLTTAAGLWSVAAIGMAIGFGWYIQAIIASILIFIVFAIKTDKNKWY